MDEKPTGDNMQQPDETQKQDQKPKTVAQCVDKLRTDLNRIDAASKEQPDEAGRHFLRGHMAVFRADAKALAAAVEAHGKEAKA